MKNLIKTIFVLLLLAFANSIHAQNACEFDSSYSIENGKGYKVIETKDKKLLVAGISGYQIKTGQSEEQILFITKTDQCGNIIWSSNPDSTVKEGGKIKLLNLLEDDKGDIMIIAYYYNPFPKSASFPFSDTINAYRLIKLDVNGNIKWRKYLNNNFVVYQNTFLCTKINENKYMFLLAKDSSNFTKTEVIIFDTLANLVLRKNIDSSAYLNTKSYEFYKESKNSIIITKLENNNVKFIYIDTTAKVNNSFFNISPIGHIFSNVLLNTSKQEFIILSYDSINYFYYLGRYSLSGLLIKDTILKDTVFKSSSLVYADSNINFFTKYSLNQNKLSLILTDANNKILWKDYHQLIDNKVGFEFNDVTKTSNNAIVLVGYQNSTFGNGNNFYWLYLKKINIIKYIKTIAILGANSINTQGGLLQLTAAILPTNAANQNVIWSINDTNLANVTQTGLVIAKSNGTVIVSATASDGGGATATKTITITNQTVGINEVNLNNQITVYPNPASSVLTINQLNENFSYKIINLQGQEILNGELKKPFSSIDISKLEAGSYIIGLTTETGIYWKNFVKN